jgi:MYXO-CTERM domain-containing protein
MIGPDNDNDVAAVTAPLDIVGTAPLPAGFHAADARFAYLRLRVAGNPQMGTRLLPNAWGYELNLDGSRDTYQVLFSVSGTGATDQVAIYLHPMTKTPGDPTEPAVTPPAFTYPASTNAEYVSAGSTLGGAQDFFVDIALPWVDLAKVQITPATAVRIWAGTSTVPNALDLDLACFAGTGGTLGGIDVGTTTVDPAGAGGGGGTGGGGGGNGNGGTGPRTLEGGPGCSISGSNDSTSARSLLILAAILLVARLRRRAVQPAQRPRGIV